MNNTCYHWFYGRDHYFTAHTLSFEYSITREGKDRFFSLGDRPINYLSVHVCAREEKIQGFFFSFFFNTRRMKLIVPYNDILCREFEFSPTTFVRIPLYESIFNQIHYRPMTYYFSTHRDRTIGEETFQIRRYKDDNAILRPISWVSFGWSHWDKLKCTDSLVPSLLVKSLHHCSPIKSIRSRVTCRYATSLESQITRSSRMSVNDPLRVSSVYISMHTCTLELFSSFVSSGMIIKY